MRIAHFTDIHVSEHPSRIAFRDLLSKRLVGWANLAVCGRYALFADAGRVTRALVEDLLQLAPDHVLSTGDLTGLSLPAEFEEAREALAPLFAGEHVTGIPGNHDVYTPSALALRLYEKSFGAWTRTDLAPGDLGEDLRGLHPYPLVRLLGSDVALICLRDVHPNPLHDSSGRIGEGQLHALERILVSGRLRGRVKLLALHTSLLRATGLPDTRLHGLRDAASLFRVAARGGVDIILHGHIHARFVLPRGAASPISIANPGSLTSRRHERAYHIYRIEAGRIAIEARRYDPASSRFVEWPDAPGTGLLPPRPGEEHHPESS